MMKKTEQVHQNYVCATKPCNAEQLMAELEKLGAVAIEKDGTQHAINIEFYRSECDFIKEHHWTARCYQMRLKDEMESDLYFTIEIWWNQHVRIFETHRVHIPA